MEAQRSDWPGHWTALKIQRSVRIKNKSTKREEIKMRRKRLCE